MLVVLGAGALAFVVTRDDDPETATGDSSPSATTDGEETDGPMSSLTLRNAIDDIDQFWIEEYAKVGDGEYEPIARERILPLTTLTEPPECAGRVVPLNFIRGNAIYCDTGDYIVWDDRQLFPQLRREFGDLAPAMVMAHEWGHSIQPRAGFAGPSIFTELQADCFTGAWVQRLLAGEGEMVELSEGEIDQAVAGFLLLGDGIGVTPADPGAHGTGFDRNNAFGDGVRNGVAGCVDYFDGGIVPVDIRVDDDFAENEGNLGFDDSVELFPGSLAEYWEEVGAAESVTPADVGAIVEDGQGSCSVPNADLVEVCDDNSIVWSQDLVALHDKVGDFATALLIAKAYGEAQAEAFGFEPTGDRVECFAGAWTAYVADPDRGTVLRLSAGDLDEAIVALLEVSGGMRSTFDQVTNFQNGFFDGYESCI